MRDSKEEAEMLNEAETLCQRAYGGQSSGRFQRLVFERLQKGAERYGDGDFLTKDNLAEAIQEPPDSAAYVMLEVERIGPTLSDADRAELRQFALGAIACAVNLDIALRRLKHVRDDLLN